MLSPCPNATGREAAIALSYPQVDRVQSLEHFFPFLLWGKTQDNWDWRDRGIVLFLGGDQFFAVVIGKRLGYRTLVYAEWDARWYRWLDRFAVTKQSIITQTPPKYRYKFTLVGDLMADVALEVARDVPENIYTTDTPLIGLLPGSKAAKLAQGVPLCLAIASIIGKRRPQTRFILPVAPTLDLHALAQFADPERNPVLAEIGGVSAELIFSESGDRNQVILQTSEGLQVELITEFPAYNLLSQCSLCLTTVGANTAELAYLTVPMIVLLPTQQLDAMRSWDGIPGILANLPGIGSTFAKIINSLVIRQVKRGRLFAWPNIWANEEIVPELVGELQAADIAEMAIDFLANPSKLKQMSDQLKNLCSKSGAGQKIVEIAEQELLNFSSKQTFML
ncbi:MAG: lipid-A-disaccharide synthase [Prochloraceae cyanobacterium]